MGKWNNCRGGCKSREGKHTTQPGRQVASWRRRHLDWVFKESIRVCWSKTSQAEKINSKTKGGDKAGVQDLHHSGRQRSVGSGLRGKSGSWNWRTTGLRGSSHSQEKL